MGVEPVPDEPAAVADCDGERALVVADYHAGIERGLRRQGVELESDADARRERLLALLDRTEPDRLVVLGDLAHAIGDPEGAEHEELTTLLDAVSVPVTLVKGNHDGDLEPFLGEFEDVTVTPSHGTRIGPVGFVHGHTWPSPDVLRADVLCVGHEHPVVRLEDEVGGTRVERAWLRGGLDPDPFEAFHDLELDVRGDLVVFPAFNDRSGGTWVNVEGQEFLSPFLPAGLAGGEAYLLDGTRLGDYRRV
ncbi:metallophosphoesterase [Halomicrobium urmianum]|uniref:metallophosphoesterase n=1 Tax=Halomicrobium urmianum TaxID=1586233 RepID=UPI001CD9CE8F|nr:metallophosphoesterase [Halomicrobium urmianum]